MSLDAIVNFGKVSLSTGYNSSATSVELSSGDGAKLPDPATDGEFNLVWYQATDYPDPSDDPNVEIVRCTARSSDTLTITRAQESTSATTKNTSGKTYKMILGMTKKMIQDIGVTVENETPSGTQNGANTTFTLANTPKSGSLRLYRNGQRLKEGSGYSLSVATLTITPAPESDEELLADYRYTPT